jgi:hypothetical protein
MLNAMHEYLEKESFHFIQSHHYYRTKKTVSIFFTFVNNQDISEGDDFSSH